MFDGTIELNNLRHDPIDSISGIKEKSPLVEIFSHMAAGKDMSELNGKLKDSHGKAVSQNTIEDGVKRIRRKAYEASAGNGLAATELNELRRFAILPLLQEELQLLSFMGNYQNVGYGESVYGELRKLGADKSRAQALRGDVTFPVWETDKYPVPFVSVSGGYAVDYRKIQFGDMTFENTGMEQVRTDIRNKAARYVIWTIWNAINNTTNVHFTAQGAGITESALREVVNKIRRFGTPNIIGDYSMVSQVNQFHSYVGTTPTVGNVSQAALNELRKTGLIGMWLGSVVADIKNGFNLSAPLPDGSGFELYFPENIMFVIPSGMQSPVRSWTRGGLTSMQGSEVGSGTIMTRFDLEIAADVARTREYEIGMITDTNIAPLPVSPF